MEGDLSDYLAFYNSSYLLFQNGIYKSLYPIPVVYLFIPFTFFPPIIGYIILSIISLLLLVYMFKRQTLLWIFYMPILQVFLLGQIDIILLFLHRLDHPIARGVMTLKPHLFIMALPQMLKNRSIKFWGIFIFTVLCIYIPFILLRPSWIGEWLAQLDDGRLSHNNSASFWSIPILFLTLLLVLLPIRKQWDKILFCINPAMRPYDYVLLLDRKMGIMYYCLIPLSGITMYLANYYHADWPWVLLGLCNIFLMRKDEKIFT